MMRCYDDARSAPMRAPLSVFADIFAYAAREMMPMLFRRHAPFDAAAARYGMRLTFTMMLRFA